MKSTKRKIVALSTAFVMAFALVAAMLPATVSEAVTSKSITSINVSIKAPAVGTELKKGTDEYECSISDPAPEVTVTGEGFETISNGILWVADPNNVLKEITEEFEGQSFTVWDLNRDNIFTGTVGAGKDYYAVIEMSADSINNYEWSDNCSVTVSGGESYKFLKNPGEYSTNAYAVVKVTIAGGGESTIPVKDGYADQTVAPDAPITIGFDSPFTNFNNGTEQGKVFIDGNEVPAQYITATEGSTIITVAQDYLKQIGEGIHKMVVKFLDGSEGTANFTISSSATASGTTASGSTASSSAATTTKVAAPKTADAIPFAAIAVVFVGASVAVVTLVATRKNK